MIDNITIRVENKRDFESINEKRGYIVANKNYNWVTQSTPAYPKKGKLHNLEISVTERYAYITGSIHKFYNNLFGNGNYNHDKFDVSKCLKSIDCLSEILSFDKDQTKITKLEFGFNLKTSYDLYDLINNRTILWDYDTHKRRDKYKSNGIGKKFGRRDYTIKIYDKEVESKFRVKSLMRIELCIAKSRVLERLKINKLSDININAFKRLFKEFYKQFDRLLILDSLDVPAGVFLDEHALFEQSKNIDTWEKLKSRPLQTRKRYKRQFLKLLESFNYLNTKSTLSNLIKEQYQQLIQPVGLTKELHNDLFN